ncbi:hypothetical protein ACGF8B_38140 [Streptomyces sp. NPDC047917]|uniref:hypothetical protein n=1 Tax=Streptomyces sp. NPDC047917 TaxID=3365491 RepID=UPI003714398E
MQGLGGFRAAGRYSVAAVYCSPGINDACGDPEWAMWHLPPGAERDLGCLITRIDEELERRTSPEPNHIELSTFG